MIIFFLYINNNNIKKAFDVNQYLRILYGPSSIDRTQISRQTASEQLLLFQKDKLAWI